jgi:hypothetical protein
MCAGIIADLERRRLAARAADDNLYQYFAADVETARLVDQLAEYYRDRRVAVVTELYSKPTKKVQTFADAFRLRREE